jgi:regulatory protein YycI of two-component signal transduction system YycFG
MNKGDEMSFKDNSKKQQFAFIIIATLIVISICLAIFSCNQKQTTNMIINHENDNDKTINVEGDSTYHSITIYDGEGNMVANYKGKYNALRNGQILTLTDDTSDDIITISLGDNYTIVDIAGSTNDTIATVR